MRHGYYVNGRRYSSEQRSQAIARANCLASEYGRDVPVIYVGHDGRRTTEYNARPNLENSMRGALLAVM
jgi:hypothetical protein